MLVALVSYACGGDDPAGISGSDFDGVFELVPVVFDGDGGCRRLVEDFA